VFLVLLPVVTVLVDELVLLAVAGGVKVNVVALATPGSAIIRNATKDKRSFFTASEPHRRKFV
jgi:hypothetical protein